nr:hypothetical protein [Tanacetum cinerariifolium]
MELKKILIEKMEGNKSIQRSDKQRNLYKALVEAYEANKIILDSYGERVILKRRRDDDDDQGEGPSAGSDRGLKRQREGKESESAHALLEPATRSAGRSTTGSKSRQVSASESAFTEEPVQTISQIEEPSHQKPPTLDRDWNKTLLAVQGSAQTWISELAKQANSRSSFNKLLDTPIDFSNFIMNRLEVDTLTPELLAGPTYELMRGSCNSLIELEYHLEEPLPLIPNNRGRRIIPFAHFINNYLEYLRGEDTESGGGDDEETESDRGSEEEETREEEEESFDPIPRTLKDNEDDGNGEADQGLRVSEEQRLIEEEEADELCRGD